MANYRVKKQPPTKEYTSTGGILVKVPRISKFTVMKGSTIISHIPDYINNAEGLANLITKLLNENKKYKLEPDI